VSQPQSPAPLPLQAVGKYLAIIAGYVTGLTLLLTVTFLLLKIPPAEGLNQLWTGAVGSAADGHLYAVSETLVEMAPLLLASLSVCIAWRAGLFSIGAQGQILMGALCATAIARWLTGTAAPAPFITLVMIVAAVGAGAAWGLLAGLMRVKRGVQEVISTIMLNYTAVHVVSWLVLGPLRARGAYRTESDSLPDSVLFARLIPAAWSDHIQTSLHVGVLLACIVCPLVYLYMFKTPQGFQMRVLGANDEAARTAHYPANSLKLRAMAISGGLAALGGVIQLLGGATGSLPAASFSGNTGFTAIPAALLGGLHPAGAFLTSLFFAGLTQGCRNLEQNTGVSSVVLYVVQAAAVLAVVGIRAAKQRKETEAV
jgi:general nucleoside transport system permease protein